MKKFLLLALLLGTSLLLAGQALAASGTGPTDALLPVGQAQTVAPHSSLWYYFDYSGGKSPITAVLDDNGASGVGLAIYTPEEIANWQNGDPLKAIGAGAPVVGHDLGWSGSFTFAGRFYAVVSNESDSPVSVRLGVSGDNVTTFVNSVPTPTPFPNPFATVTPLGKGFQGQIAFEDSAGGNLYIVNGDGTGLARVSFGMDPQWNHAGTQLALARQGPVPGIFTINADGSNENLAYGAQEVRAPDWSPDDSRLVFSQAAGSKGGGQFCFRNRCFDLPADTLWKLATVSSSGGSFLDLQATSHAFTPTWNSDGVTVAFNDPSIGIMQTSVNGDVNPWPFIGDLRVTEPSYNPLKLMSPQYSPDGKSIVYMVYQQPAWQIAVASADGRNQHLLTSIDPLDFQHPNNVAPIWSPDGKQILFLSDRNGKWEFFLMNSDGSGQQQVLKSVSDRVSIVYEFEGERMMTWKK